jgi:hypothetical protein
LPSVSNNAIRNDLVKDRYYFEPSFLGDVKYGYSLCLYALSRIYEKKGAFTGGQRARHFPSKIDVSLQALGHLCARKILKSRQWTDWSVNEVQQMLLAVKRVYHAGATMNK